MKERFIQAFWYLILALTISDLLFLLYWMHRYDLIVRSMRHHLTTRLQQSYGYWDADEAERLHSHLETNTSDPIAPGSILAEEVNGENYATSAKTPADTLNLPSWWLLFRPDYDRYKSPALSFSAGGSEVIGKFDKILTVSVFQLCNNCAETERATIES